MNDVSPKPNGGNGRNPNGTFATGNKGGPGRKRSNRGELVNRIADELVTEEDARAVWQKLIDCAKDGEPWAIKEFLDRTIGKPKESIDMTGSLAVTVADFFRQAAERVLVRN